MMVINVVVNKNQSKFYFLFLFLKKNFFFFSCVAHNQFLPKRQDMADTNVSEMRRQIHIQSEQKRRAQIKDGFEDLRSELPACLNKKMSKVTLLHRSKF